MFKSIVLITLLMANSSYSQAGYSLDDYNMVKQASDHRRPSEVVREKGRPLNLRGANLKNAFLGRGYVNRLVPRKVDFGDESLNKDYERIFTYNNKGHSGEADLSESDLRGVIFTNAFLDRVNFKGSDLSGADLRDASLKWANLESATLGTANLKNAILDKTKLKGVKITYTGNPDQLKSWLSQNTKGWKNAIGTETIEFISVEPTLKNYSAVKGYFTDMDILF